MDRTPFRGDHILAKASHDFACQFVYSAYALPFLALSPLLIKERNQLSTQSSGI